MEMGGTPALLADVLVVQLGRPRFPGAKRIYNLPARRDRYISAIKTGRWRDIKPLMEFAAVGRRLSAYLDFDNSLRARLELYVAGSRKYQVRVSLRRLHEILNRPGARAHLALPPRSYRWEQSNFP